jgi:hypothetical protein
LERAVAVLFQPFQSFQTFDMWVRTVLHVV